jgi:very-short-patch-repair endonuclease
MKRNVRNRTPAAQERARQLRKEMSVSEKTLWTLLRKEKLGYRFRRQVAVGPYFLDFYCPRASLAVEVDGEQHDARKAQDAERDLWLRDHGIEVFRIPSLVLFGKGNSLSKTMRELAALCEVRAGLGTPPPPPSSSCP